MMKWMKWGVMSVALSTVACGDPAVGVWTATIEDEEEDVTTDIELTLEKGGEGRMVMDVTSGIVSFEIDLDVEWEKTSKGEYELDPTCVSVEPDLSEFGVSCDTFELEPIECVLSSNKEKMTCDDGEGTDPIVLEAE